MSQWARLYRGDPLATPFVSPGWARAWLSAWAETEEPFVLQVFEGDRTVAIAPLAIGRRAGLRTLGMLGKEPGDYWDIVAEPEHRRAAAVAVGTALAGRRDAWDLGVLSCMPPGSVTDRAFEEAGLRVHHRAVVPSPAITLPATFDEYLGTLSRRHRHNLRRHLRRLDEGEVDLRVVTDPGRLPAVIDTWQELRARQWRAFDKAITESHTTDRFRRFMLAAVENLAVAGEAPVWEFLREGEVVGVYVSFADARSLYWYLGGFDPAVKDMGLGKIAVGHGIRLSIEAGRERFDFTRGGEPYKYWFGGVDRFVESLLVGHAGVRSRVALPVAVLEATRRDRALSATAGGADD